MSQGEEDLEDIVDVLDKDFRIIFRGPDEVAVDWICENPLGPYMVWLEDCKDLMSIDEYMTEWGEINND